MEELSRWQGQETRQGQRAVVGLVVVLAMFMGGCALFATKKVVNRFIEKVTIEVDYASLTPILDPAIILGADPKVEVSIEVAVTNGNGIDLDIHDITMVGRLGELVILEATPEFPQKPMELPAGQTVRVTIRTSVPLLTLAAVPFELFEKGEAGLTMEGSVTGEGMGVRMTRKFTIDSVDARMQPTLRW